MEEDSEGGGKHGKCSVRAGGAFADGYVQKEDARDGRGSYPEREALIRSFKEEGEWESDG